MPSKVEDEQVLVDEGRGARAAEMVAMQVAPRPERLARRPCPGRPCHRCRSGRRRARPRRPAWARRRCSARRSAPASRPRRRGYRARSGPSRDRRTGRTVACRRRWQWSARSACPRRRATNGRGRGSPFSSGRFSSRSRSGGGRPAGRMPLAAGPRNCGQGSSAAGGGGEKQNRQCKRVHTYQSSIPKPFQSSFFLLASIDSSFLKSLSAAERAVFNLESKRDRSCWASALQRLISAARLSSRPSSRRRRRVGRSLRRRRT